MFPRIRSAAVLLLSLASPALALEGPVIPVSGSCGIADADGALHAVGPDYKARFEPAGMEFTPAVGCAAEKNLTLRLETESIRRGASTLDVGTGTSPERHGSNERMAKYRRGSGITERFEARTDGLEWSFRFDSRPAGLGDLVVRARVVTDLAATAPSPSGITFERPGVGGIRVGGVTGINALGATVTGGLRLDGEMLELSLPGEFLDRATYPIVLDPLIGGIFPVTKGTDQDWTQDASYDPDNNHYLVVWAREYSTTDYDVLGQLLNTDGKPVGGPILIESDPTKNSRDVSVAFVQSRGHFVVVWEQAAEIFCRAVDSLKGGVSKTIPVATGPDFMTGSDIGGEPGVWADSAIVTWTNQTTGVILGAQITVDTKGTGNPLVFNTRTLVKGEPTWHTEISKGCCRAERYLMVYTTDVPGVSQEVRGVLLDSQLNVLDSGIPITTDPRYDYRPAVDGDGEHFMVFYESTVTPHSLNSNLYGVFVWLDLSGKAIVGPWTWVATEPENERLPAIACMGDSFLLAWSKEVSPTNYDLYVKHVDLFTPAPAEGEFIVYKGADSPEFPAIASRRGTDLVEGDSALIAWTRRNLTAGQATIDGQIFQAHDGIMVHMSGDAGHGGVAYGTSAIVGNPYFLFRLERAHPKTGTWFLLGFGSLNHPCGTGKVIPNPSPGFLVYTGKSDADGNHYLQVPLPANPALAGLTVYTQWLQPVAKPSCPDLGVDLSTGVRITFEG